MRLSPKASKVIDRQDLGRAVRTLAYGTVGGAVFYWFNMPLAWMMGAMVATTVMSMTGADIATFPWTARCEWQGISLDEFPNVKRWFETIYARPAVKRGMDTVYDELMT